MLKTTRLKLTITGFVIVLLCQFGESRILQLDKAAIMKKLAVINQHFAKAAKEKNPKLILPYYSDATLFIPEFHPMIIGKKHIQNYYQRIYQRQNIQSYERTTKDVIHFADRAVEWGTFKIMLSQNGNAQTFELIGKYLNVWRLSPNGEMELKSEEWNYDHKIDEELDLIVKVKGMPLRYKTQAAKNIDSSLKYELDAYHALGAKAVRERDAMGRLYFYSKDGIFLAPHGETAKIGFEAIKEHLIGYNSGEVKIDAIDVGYNHVEDYGEYLIKNNYYYVEASGEGWTHKGQGLGTSLFRRNKSGQLKRVWQIGSEQPVVEAPIANELVQFEEASTESLLKNNAALRTTFYGKEIYLLGEYQPVLKGPSSVEDYYKAFLNRFQISTYQKERLEVLDMESWLVETGTFEMALTEKETNENIPLEGKYQNLWRKNEQGRWKLFAEAWNYNHWVDHWERFTFPELKTYDHLAVELKEVPLQVIALNKLAEEIISDHDPKKWTQLYDGQGMLLYSHSPLYNGKPAIKAHLEEHVKGLPIFNTLDIGNYYLEELDNYIIELGNHVVNWSNGGQQGISIGKNVRIWKKHEDGCLKIFRQIAMYDHNTPLAEIQINPFRKFFGEWTLKNDKWEQSNAKNEREIIDRPNHYSICKSLNTNQSLLWRVKTDDFAGDCLWTYNPTTQKVFHLSHFGDSRDGVGEGTIDKDGNLKLKVGFNDERKGTYRYYEYKWVNDNEYTLSSTQYKDGKPTGHYYGGTFIRLQHQ